MTTAVDIEQEVIRFVKENYFDPDMTLERAAQRIGRPSRSIQRSLDACHNNWLSILVSVRMEKARELLTQTDSSIEEVALAVGYFNTTAFRKNYRRKYGQSPSKTRKEARSRGIG